MTYTLGELEDDVKYFKKVTGLNVFIKGVGNGDIKIIPIRKSEKINYIG